MRCQRWHVRQTWHGGGAEVTEGIKTAACRTMPRSITVLRMSVAIITVDATIFLVTTQDQHQATTTHQRWKIALAVLMSPVSLAKNDGGRQH